ncbi:hypothetical protein SDC9_137664 [bioreactor metagenome]|uniref:Uncharacterized protein n=1 Tax=bioreactor metagenome TaxID=1076179 RepID=A0A645DP43_9ZZZZ
MVEQLSFRRRQRQRDRQLHDAGSGVVSDCQIQRQRRFSSRRDHAGKRVGVAFQRVLNSLAVRIPELQRQRPFFPGQPDCVFGYGDQLSDGRGGPFFHAQVKRQRFGVQENDAVHRGQRFLVAEEIDQPDRGRTAEAEAE